MSDTALVLIDIQNEYFPGGNLPLEEPEAAARAARLALYAARESGLVVVHVRHESPDPAAARFRALSRGSEIHDLVAPAAGEKVVTKRIVDSFAGTDLEEFLRSFGVRDIAVAGMMTHMCVDAFLRAASARGFPCSLLVDATATRELEWAGRRVGAADVKAAFYAAFSFFGTRMLESRAWTESLL